MAAMCLTVATVTFTIANSGQIQRAVPSDVLKNILTSLIMLTLLMNSHPCD